MPSDVAWSNDAGALVMNLNSNAHPGTNDEVNDAADHNKRSPASSSARLKDVADSYLRQLHGGNTTTRILAAQGLGALPSFLPPAQGADALRRAVELGVLGSLIDVLVMDDEMPVQEACLMAVAALLVSTAPYEDHSAPVRPLHLKLLGASILRPEVVTQIGYLLTATTNSRVVLAAARVVAITAPYITQANDIYVLNSRLIPALLAAAAARPDPNSGERRTSGHANGDGGSGVPAVTSGSITPRDAAVCVLALLTLAQATPDLYATVCTADFLQAVSVLYERCIDPGQTSDAVLPADAAALLLQAATLAPNPRWLLPKLSPGHARTMERNLEDSNVLDCLLSFVAVETGNLRKLGDDLAAAAGGNAAAVIEQNSLDMEQLQAEMRERRQQLAEARVEMQDALRKLETAEAEAARAKREAETAVQRGGDSPERRQARREAEADAVAAEAEAEERRRGVDAAEVAVEQLQVEVAALRRAVAPLRWQNERMARLRDVMQAWREQYGFKSRSKMKLSRPNLAMLIQVLAFLESGVKPGLPLERGTRQSGGPVAAGPSREHVAAVQAKLLEAGLVQALVQLFTVMSGMSSLMEEFAALEGDLALQPDLAEALKGAATLLQREASGLSAINRRAELRLQQVHAEASRLRKALKLELPLPEGSAIGVSVELRPGNGLSRTVRQEDVQQRLEALESELNDLEAALGNSEPLVDFLQERIKAVDAASSAVSDSYATFLKAFPSQAAPTTPAIAPAGGRDVPSPSSPSVFPAGNANGHANDKKEPHSRTLRLASRSIMAKDLTHPAGHLLGLLSRVLAPVSRGSVLNVPALLRQLLGRPPDGTASAAWPPLPANPPEAPPSNSAPADRPRSRSTGRIRSKSVGSAAVAGERPNSASVQGIAAAQPTSARSIGAGANAERSSIMGGLRASGGFGVSFGTTGYGSGFGSFPGNGPFPTDYKGRPVRYSKDSMYGIIQEKSIPRSSTATGQGSQTATPGASAVLVARNSVTIPVVAPELAASVSMPLAEESRRVVHQAVSSVLFDPIDPNVLGPGLARASAASLTLPDGLTSRPSMVYGSRAHGATARSMPLEAAEPEKPAEAASGSDTSVLDALLMQSELLCEVMRALAVLQQFSKSTTRICRQLPAAVSYASLRPGALGPYMARLHAMWAAAIARHPEMRVQIADSVAEIAQLALVPGSDFEAVYRNTGMLEMLVQMLASGLRPAKTGAKVGVRKPVAGGEETVKTGATGLKPRYVGRLTATAPPTLRVGPAQQAEQAAAGQALRAISQAQNEVLGSIAQDEKLLTRLSMLVLDHSMSWAARQASADLLSDLVLGGSPGAEAAVASGAYAGLVEMLNRDMYPFLNQDPRCSKETVVSALACLVAHPELLEGVVAAAKATHGPSSGLPLSCTQQVMSAILRSLWQVVWQVYTTYTSNRTGHGRYVDPDLISALTSTAATAARELAVLADTVAEARRMMISDMGLRSKVNPPFLQAIKNSPLQEALVELRKNLS
ncbi:hypothetical protein VaNZ11_009222 [Volvox africanus]|uniref:Uncharacterized protein n=1 Tax=Volvox africanus TaxID=51714 RepID=A0ABQ5S943_9CHLO|nr:hypothetical protein VaNZ11_009222 [Volvox africanus]